MRESSATHQHWLCDLGWPLLPVWDAVSASICGQGLCNYSTPVQTLWPGITQAAQPRASGDCLALVLLFSLRVCGGFSLGLRVPLFKGVSDSLGCLAKGPVCVCVCVHVYIPPCVSIFNM